jgi:hypothetical protein
MKIELELDERELATNITLERIIKEVMARLDEKIGTMVMEKVEEAFDEKVEGVLEPEDTLEDLLPAWVDNPLLEEVTVVSSEGVKTCTKLESVLDSKLEEVIDRATQNVIRRVRMMYGEPPARNDRDADGTPFGLDHPIDAKTSRAPTKIGIGWNLKQDEPKSKST